MPHVISDRVLEASTSSGTGPFALSGAALGYRAFSAVCAVADTVPYYIEAVDAQGRPTGDWEFGLGTYTAANQLTRTTVRGSSNGGLVVSFPAGNKLVGLGVPAPNSAATRAEWRSSLGFTPTGESLALAASPAVVQALLPLNQARIDVPSAATVNLTTAAPNTDSINFTGTTAITGFTVAAGRMVFARFAGSLTLTSGAGIVTQTGANIVTQAGDTCILRATAVNVVEVLSYVPAVLNQQTTRSMVRLSTSNGNGSTNTAIRRFTTVQANQGSDITYADSATLGASFTINAAGVYAISYNDSSSAAFNMAFSLNSMSLTTNPPSIPAAERLAMTQTNLANGFAALPWTGYLPAGSVVRPHVDAGAANGSPNTASFTIVRVA